MCSRRSISEERKTQPSELVDDKEDFSHIDDCDEILGSRLELELNLSIEKMREEEAMSPIFHHSSPEDSIRISSKDSITSSLHSKSKSPTATMNSTVELLEDIEMPTLSISQCESADLISVSSASFNSPVKLPDHCKAEISSGYVVDMMNKYVQPKETPSSQFTGEPNTKEMDVYEKVAFLSTPLTANIKNLVSVDEIGTASVKEVDKDSHTADVSSTKIRDVEPEVEDITTNVTSSPITSPNLHLTLGTGLELLDIDNMNDSLLTSSVLVNFPVKEENNGTFTHSLFPTLLKKTDPVEVKKELSGSEKSYSSEFLAEACGVVTELENFAVNLTSSSPTSSDHQNTIHPLDMDIMNDSLLSSFHLTNSPSKEIYPQDVFISPLPPTLVEKKNPGSKCEMTTSNGNMKINNCTFDGSANLLNENINGSDNFAVRMTRLQEDKNIEVTGINNYEKLKPCLNTTFDQDNKQCMNATFEKKDAHLAHNLTFDKQLDKSATIAFNRKTTNTSFNHVVHCVNRTFDGKDLKAANPPMQCINTTFEKEPQQTDTTFISKPLESEVSEKDAVNVIFERGEYKIPSLNETVSLMDAEGEVLQIILNSTPKKASKTAPGGVSTPRCGNKPPQSKRTSFLDRISLGVRRDNQSQDPQDDKSSSSQDVNTRPIMPGLRVGCIDQQTVASQLRRRHTGASSQRSGPLRALPLQSLGTQSQEKQHESFSTPDSLEGMKGCIQHGERPSVPSFGSVSSIENERPGTPDIGIITGIGLSTPDIVRSQDLPTGPRITSTPAMRVGVYSCVVGIEGQAPTPITAPASRSRVVSISSTASLPEGRCNDSLVWQGFSQESAKDSRRTASIPDDRASGISKEDSETCKPTPDNLDTNISVGTVEMPQSKEQRIGSEGICAEALNVQKICGKEKVVIENANQETAKESNSIIHKNDITQTACDRLVSSPIPLIVEDESQNLATAVGGEYLLKSDTYGDVHNSSGQMNCQSQLIADDGQESASINCHAHINDDVIEEKAKFTMNLESKADRRVEFIAEENATSSEETPHQAKITCEKKQHDNSTIEKELEVTNDIKRQRQTNDHEKQLVGTSAEHLLVDNNDVKKELVKTSDDKVHHLKTGVCESQQTNAGKEIDSHNVENQQVDFIVGENQHVATNGSDGQQVDKKQTNSRVGEKQKVKTNVVLRQPLQDLSDPNNHSKKLNKSRLVADVQTDQTKDTKKIETKLKICKEVSKNIIVTSGQQSIVLNSSSSSSLVQKCKSNFKGHPNRRRSLSQVGVKPTATTGAKGDSDGKSIGESCVALKVNSSKVVPSKNTSAIPKKSIANDRKSLQSSSRSLDKDNKENKRESTEVGTTQVKKRVSLLHKKRVPVAELVLRSSNSGARRSLVTQPVALKDTFLAEKKIPLKTPTNLRPSKTNCVKIKITAEEDKTKGFSHEPKNVSPKSCTLKQPTFSSLPKGQRSSLGKSGKISNVQSSPQSKLPVVARHTSKLPYEQQTLDPSQGDPIPECHIISKSSRRLTEVAPVASRKLSLIRAPKSVVR